VELKGIIYGVVLCVVLCCCVVTVIKTNLLHSNFLASKSPLVLLLAAFFFLAARQYAMCTIFILKHPLADDVDSGVAMHYYIIISSAFVIVMTV
jgi:hypothetical protein